MIRTFVDMEGDIIFEGTPTSEEIKSLKRGDHITIRFDRARGEFAPSLNRRIAWVSGRFQKINDNHIELMATFAENDLGLGNNIDATVMRFELNSIVSLRIDGKRRGEMQVQRTAVLVVLGTLIILIAFKMPVEYALFLAIFVGLAFFFVMK